MGCLCSISNVKEVTEPHIPPGSQNEIKEEEDKVTVGSDIYIKIKEFSPKRGGFGEVLKLKKNKTFYALKKIKIEEKIKEERIEEKIKEENIKEKMEEKKIEEKMEVQEENKIEEEKNDNLSMCENEVNIMKIFKTDYIIKLVGSHKGEDYFRILMEYGGDSNLKEYIKQVKEKNQQIDEKNIAEMILQICHGLEEIHKHKIVHRDLTPEKYI